MRTGKPDSTLAPRNRRRIIIPAITATVALSVGWAVGRHITISVHTVLNRAARAFPINASGDHQPTVEDIATNFQAGVSRWNQYVTSSRGRLPADPYRALLDVHVMSDVRVRDARALRVIEFARPLPPNLSPRLGENPHLPVFWWKDPWIAPGEEWVYYADGTWARRTECVDASAWRETLRRSGYPVDQWTTWKARAAWISENQ